MLSLRVCSDAGLKFYAEPQPYVVANTGQHMAGSVVLQCRQNPETFVSGNGPAA